METPVGFELGTEIKMDEGQRKELVPIEQSETAREDT